MQTLSTFCQLIGRRLHGQTLRTLPDWDKISCLHECNAISECTSFNYYTESGVGVCELYELPADGATMTLYESVNATYYSSHGCHDILTYLAGG